MINAKADCMGSIAIFDTSPVMILTAKVYRLKKDGYTSYEYLDRREFINKYEDSFDLEINEEFIIEHINDIKSGSSLSNSIYPYLLRCDNIRSEVKNKMKLLMI